METSSTLRNWCWRSIPRVSRPEAPASLRKQSLSAVSRIGSFASGTISPATVLVSGISLVAISQRPSVVRNESSANLGSWLVPNIVASFTRNGTVCSV